MIELGVPFSDPIADGPTIQRASERALAAGATLAAVLDLARRAPGPAGSTTPVVVFSYANPILAMGEAEFAHRAREAGADGVLVTDLPPEEGRAFASILKSARLDPVYLLAPTSPDDRLRRAAVALARVRLPRVAQRDHGRARGASRGARRRSWRACGGPVPRLPLAVGLRHLDARAGPGGRAARGRRRRRERRRRRDGDGGPGGPGPGGRGRRRSSGTSPGPRRSRRVRRMDEPLSARISRADRQGLVELVAGPPDRLTERDAAQALRHPHASEAMIVEILASRTLMASRAVRRLVAAHPQTPRHDALHALDDLLVARPAGHRPRDADAAPRAAGGEPEAPRGDAGDGDRGRGSPSRGSPRPPSFRPSSTRRTAACSRRSSRTRG